MERGGGLARIAVFARGCQTFGSTRLPHARNRAAEVTLAANHLEALLQVGPRHLSKLSIVLAIAATILAATAPCFASAQDLGVLVRLTSGDIEIYNSGVTSTDIVGYSLESASSGLLYDNWQPIAGRLDAAGDASFDPVGSWLLLSETDSMTDLSEGVLSGDGGTLAADQLLSIGNAWNLASSQQLTASILSGNDTLNAPVTFVPLGDYNWDGNVDSDDYTLWRTNFGSTENLRADGNGNGTIDIGDYTIWRDALESFAATPAGSGAASSNFATATPEPSTAVLIGLALAASCCCFRCPTSAR